MKRSSGIPLAVTALAILIGGALAQSTRTPAVDPAKEWPTYGHDPGAMRYSPLTEIKPANIEKLKVAWVYHMKPAAATPATPPPAPAAARGGEPQGDVPDAPPAGRGRGGRGAGGFSPSEVTPLVKDGIMYTSTPYGRLVALDPTSGKEVWTYQLPSSSPSTRGVEFWAGDRQTTPQIVFGTSDGKLYSIDAKTGKPNNGFGDNGVVNLNTPEILGDFGRNDGLSSPPIVYKNLVITGGTTQELPSKGSSGDVRAWDMHTGKLQWTFHSIPRAGEKFNDTWAPDSWKQRSGVNVWGFLSVDAERGIVYMPFGGPSVDQWGGDRAGDNLFGNSIVAADAMTGKYLWHFQVVHHDLWDSDLTAPLVLLDVKQGGKTIPAVAAVGKSALLFLLDRVTGKPIYGYEERPVPQSEVPGEHSSKTQPVPLKPPPLSRNTFTMAEIATVTPELEAACRKLLEGVQLGGPYLPPSYNKLGARFPGNHGGVNWGGMSFDPQLGYLFINTSELGQLSGQKDHDSKTGRAQGRGTGNRVDPEGPVEGVLGGGRLSIPGVDSPQQLPCQQPPWGLLTAVNVNTGEFAWRVPLGVTDSLPPEKQKTGRPGNGGPIVTAGGLVFVAATDDARFRAFESKTGKEVWTYKLKGAAQATPMTYQGADGKQYVVIAATGGGFFNNPVNDDSIIAFALDTAK